MRLFKSRDTIYANPQGRMATVMTMYDEGGNSFEVFLDLNSDGTVTWELVK